MDKTDDVEILYDLLPTDGKGLGHGKAIQTLGWTPARYEAAKFILIESESAAPWKGRGGSLRRIPQD